MNIETFLLDIEYFLHLDFHPLFVPFHLQSSYSNESLPRTLALLRIFGVVAKGHGTFWRAAGRIMGKLGKSNGTWESAKRSALPMIPYVATA